MADNKLIFPIGFDLEAGVEDAMKNGDRALTRIESVFARRPIALKVDASGVGELCKSIDALVANLTRLNGLLAGGGTTSAITEQQQLAHAVDEHGRAVESATGAMGRNVAEQEKVNKALRDTYVEQEKVNKLITQYHDTYEGQIESLARLNSQLAANKKAQSDNEKALSMGRKSAREYAATNAELMAQHRQLTQEKRALTQIMTAEEKMLMSQEGSYAQLSQQLSLLKTAYKDLGDEGRNSQFGQELSGAIQALDAQLKGMAASMGEFQRNVGNYSLAGQNGVVTTESLTAAISQEARTTQDLIDQTRILEDAKRMINREDANYNSTIAALNTKLDENRRKLSDVSDILGKEAKSVAEAEAQNKRLSEAMKHIDLTSSDAKKKLEEMRSQIERNNRTISAATGANERYAESVLGLVGVNANFGRSLQGLGNGGNFIDGLGIKIKALGKSVMGLLANPWVLAILGIAGVAAGFKWWYEYNKGLIEASRLTENFTGLTGEAADKITADMQTLADHMGKGYKESIGAANVLVQQFGVSWEEAMKLMQDGIVAGADMSGNMVSNIERFAPALRDAGVSADEFMSILAETRNGVFNEQGIQDIVKGGTRLRAMTKQIAESLDAVGISSAQMQKDLSDGTITMFDAVQTVAAKLKELPENSQEAGNIMKHVFGRTAAEGGTLLIQSIADVNTNLDEAKNRMGELGKANEEQMNAQRELNEALSAVFKVSGTNFEIMIAKVKTFAAQGLTKVIKGCADIVNWFIRMYNKSIVVRAGVSSIVNSFKTLWEISKFVFNQIIDSFTAAGTIMEGIVTLDWDKVKKGYTDGMKALGNNITTLAKNIASNTADAFNDTLNGQMKEVSVKLDADTSGATPVRDGSGDDNSEGITPVGGKVDKEAAKTYLQTLNKIEQSITAIYTKYGELVKQEGNTQALEHINELYKTQLSYLNSMAGQFGLSFDMPTSFKSLQEYRNAILDVIKRLNESGVKGAQSAALELEMKIGLGNVDSVSKELERNLTMMSDRISRTKTAKEFYDKILSTTGDIDLAASVTMSIYGDVGSGLFDAVVSQIQETFKTGNIEVDAQIGIDLQGVIDTENERINYAELARIYDKYQDQIIAKNRNTAENIIKEGQKTAASNIAMWEKELAKAKDYEEQRTDIIKRETQRRAEIYKSNLPQEEKDRLAAQSQSRQDEDLAKLNFEEFTKSEDYIRIFENLDNVATGSLKRLREEMQSLIDTNHDLSPENMKTLVKAMENIDEQIGERNPFETLVSSAKEYVNSIKNIKIAKQELAAAEAEYKAQKPQLTADVNTAKTQKATADANVVLAEQNLLSIQQQIADLRAQEIFDETLLASLREREIVAENNLVRAKLRQNQAETNVTMAVQKQTNAQGKVNKAQKKVNKEADNAKKSQNKFLKATNNVQKTIGAVQTAMEALSPILGDLTKEGTAFGDAWATVTMMIGTFQSLMSVVITLQEVFNVVTASNPWLAIASAVLAVISALSFGIGAAKVRKANKEIEKQQELLDQLEYTYGRLEKAADKAFGRDYVNNYNQQLKNLQAQQTAYLKMAEAERSKGKKEDEAKTQEYLNNAREAANKIKELQDDLTAHFTGSSRTDAARQMAKSWIDAKASMSDTFAAIKGDYADMIKNMIVEGAAARVIENALTPVWDSMDRMLKQNNVQGAIDSLIGGMDSALSQANNGMEVLWKALEARGYDMKQLIGDTDSEYTGIAKSVAGATSEEINNVAAIGNTLLYYVSPIPRIDENLARVVAIMEGRGASAIPQTTSAGWTDWQQQAMDSYQAIARNTAETVVRCERAAIACEKMARVIKTKGATSGFNVFLNS